MPANDLIILTLMAISVIATALIGIAVCLFAIWGILRLCNMLFAGASSRTKALNIIVGLLVVPQLIFMMVALIWFPAILGLAFMNLLLAVASAGLIRTLVPLLLKNQPPPAE